MACCLTPAQIEALRGGNLSPKDKRLAEAHIATCETCRSQVESQQAESQLAGDIKQAYRAETVASDGRPEKTKFSPPGSDSIEGYEILREMHRGGQGVVYKAVQKATKRTVALKVLLQGPYASAKQRHRFEREIDLVAGLQHPNIVTVYDSGITKDQRHFFAMEYVHGQPLDVYLSDKNLSIDDTLRLFQKVCAAVTHAHQRGVIHRDLKPNNILVDANGEPHVLDFGLAKAAGANLAEGMPVTVTGEFMGTLAYASPEQTKGDPNLIDIRTDVYSLGVILYEMLTSKYPYEVIGQMADVLRNIAEAEPQKPSTIRRQINDEVETIVLMALAKEKERRYQSAEALARDVEHYLTGEPIDAKRDSGWYVLKKGLRRYRVPVAVATGYAIVVTASMIATWGLWKEADRAQEAETVAKNQALRVMQRSLSSMPEDPGVQLETLRQLQLEVQELGDLEASDPDTAAALEELVQALVDEIQRTAMLIKRRSSDDQIMRLEALSDEIESHLDEGEPSKAVEAVEESLTLARAMGDDEQLGKALHRAGRTYSEIFSKSKNPADIRKKVEYDREAVSVRRQLDDKTALAQSLQSLGRALKYNRDHTEGISVLKEALEIRLQEDDTANALRVMTHLLSVVLAGDQLEELPALYDQATALIAKGTDQPDAKMIQGLLDMVKGILRFGPDGKSRLSYLMLGNRPLQRGRPAEAIPHLEKALAEARDLEDETGIGTAHNSLGHAYRQLGNNEKALEHFEPSLEIRRRQAEAAGLTEAQAKTLNGYLSTSLQAVGMIHQDRQKLDEALQHLKESMEIRRNLGSPLPISYSCHNIALLYNKMGNKQRAIEYLTEAIGIRKAEKMSNLALSSIIALAQIFRSTGDLERHDELLAEATEIVEDADPAKLDQQQLRNLYEVRARRFEDTEQYEEALELYQRSLVSAQSTGVERGAATILIKISRVHVDMDELDEADRVDEQAHAIYEELGESVPTHFAVNRAILRREQGRPEEAEKALRLALADYREKYGDQSIQAAAVMAGLAATLIALDDPRLLQEAESLLAQANSVFEVDVVKNRRFLLKTLTRQLELYDENHLNDSEKRAELEVRLSRLRQDQDGSDPVGHKGVDP